MYTDLSNKLNTGIKSRFTGFGAGQEAAAAEARQAKSLVGSAWQGLVKAFDRLGSYPAVDDAFFGLYAYLAGDLQPGSMAREARRLARSSVARADGADILAKAYRGYDYFDFLADHGYLGPASAMGAIPAAAPSEAAQAALKPAA